MSKWSGGEWKKKQIKTPHRSWRLAHAQGRVVVLREDTVLLWRVPFSLLAVSFTGIITLHLGLLRRPLVTGLTKGTTEFRRSVQRTARPFWRGRRSGTVRLCRGVLLFENIRRTVWRGQRAARGVGVGRELCRGAESRFVQPERLLQRWGTVFERRGSVHGVTPLEQMKLKNLILQITYFC